MQSYIYIYIIIFKYSTYMLAIKFDKCREIAHAPDSTVHVNENPSSSLLFLLGVARIHMNITPHHKHTCIIHLHTRVNTHTLLKDSKGLHRYCMVLQDVCLCMCVARSMPSQILGVGSFTRQIRWQVLIMTSYIPLMQRF